MMKQKRYSIQLIAGFLAISFTGFASESIPCGYNYPNTLDIACPCNIFTGITFNYWQAIQENMELGQLDNGLESNTTTSGLITTAVSTYNSFQMVNMDFNFKPSFTVTLGYNFGCDDWTLRGEYTWYHSTNKKTVIADDFAFFDESTANISPWWGIFKDTQRDVKYGQASEKWQLGMDLIDIDLGRSYYVGCNLTFYSNIGARLAFIHQNVDITYLGGFRDFSVDVPGLLGDGSLVEDKKIKNSSKSWALGPKFAVETNWILGCGFSLYGNAEVDLLFTRYTTLQEKTKLSGTVVGIIDLIPFSFAISEKTKSKQKNVNSLRTHLDLELGFDWGTYFCCNKYYLDLAAGYTFQMFFDQNMLRHDLTNPGSYIPNGNLYLHGLIVRLKLDF